MIFLEINEFSPELMAVAAKELNAKNLQRLLNLQHAETTTDDKAERFGLDPWVQWVSIHTGKTSSEHGVGHLGDVPQLEHSQIWEDLTKEGFTWGVWGAMNASKGSTKNCQFFFPDPWTFSEDAYPAELNNLLAFPRYYSKNYGDLDKERLLKELLKLCWFCLNPKIGISLASIAPKLIFHIAKYGMKEYLLFVLFDLVNAKLFALYYKKTRPDFAVLFLNSLAHLQHHKWTVENGISEEMRVAFSIFDDLLGVIFDAIPFDQPIVIANAFTQFCSYGQNEYLYRQKNPEKFLSNVGIVFDKVEQAMTNDGHVFFKTSQETQNAADVLNSATVNDKPAFHVEVSEKSPNKLFYQAIVWEKSNADTLLKINGREISFLNEFDEIVRRSGSHLQRGDVFYKGISFPDKIYNHEIFFIIKSYFSGLKKGTVNGF